jgi:hypothetical protein
MKPRLSIAAALLRFIAITALVAAAPARAQDLQVIDLHHRLADEVIPIVQPLLEAGGVLTGVDDVLFVRTSPANLEQIRQAVAAIDRAPRQLLITVGQGTVRTGDAAAVRGSAAIGGGDVQVRAHGGSLSQQASLQNVSSIRTLDGNETFIAIGQSGPYASVSTGFYATARVSGDNVTLEVSPRQQRMTNGHGGIVESSGAASTVTARLGEWIEIGAVRDTTAGSTGGLLVWGRSSGTAEYSAWIKVDEVR